MILQNNDLDIRKTLFLILKNDYEQKSEQTRFYNGLDYLETMVKFFAVLSISIVKELDKKIYQEIFFKNFKLSPSFGDFKSLSTQPFIKKNVANLLNKDDLYDRLYNLIVKKELNLYLNMAEDIISDHIEHKKKFKNLWFLIEEYVVNFRNKLKGHGASFREDDNVLSDTILKNLDKTIKAMEDVLYTLLDDENLKFYYKNDKTVDEIHQIHEVKANYKGKEYKLSPLLIYLTCDKFSCTKSHRVKLFFYNDGRASKSYYLDYGYNHHVYFSLHNEINSTLKSIQNMKKEINRHDTSDSKRKSNLLKVFIGRQEELKTSKEHILKNIKNNTSSAITIKGKPGTGKSAFVSKLQQELKESKKDIKSYIFYARKGEMGEEDRYFYNKLSNYLLNIDIEIKTLKNSKEATAIEKLQNLFDSIKEQLKEPLVLIIDGLDEFKKPEEFLENLPLSNIPSNVHLVFTTRGYQNILDTLQQKLFDSEFDILKKESYLANNSSLILEGLEKYEVEILINEVLTKDIQRDTDIYKEIQEQIYKRSQGLPLYIYYITDKLISLHIDENDDIPKKILEYAKELPQGLDEFYYSAFRNLEPMASQILYILYFSPKDISFSALYYLINIINKDKKIDKKSFHNNYFSKVEIFLSQNRDERYGFYHLSVKEAIKSYFIHTPNLQHIVEIDYDTFAQYISIADYQVEQYKELFNELYYLKEDSDLFNLIEILQKTLQEKQNDKNLKEFFKDNFLGIYAKYIQFKILHKIIDYKDIKAKEYSKFDSFKLSTDLKALIENFFTIYEKSYKTDIDEIRLAFEFALLVEDYDKVLKYADDYQESFTNLFIDICWNLDKEENKKLFKELKPIWSEIFSDDFKRVLLSNDRIAGFTEEALEIVNSIEDDWKKTVVLSLIAQKTDDTNLALKIANSIEDDWEKTVVLSSIAQKIDDINLALKIANSIENDWERACTLALIAQKTDDTNLALKIANSIENKRKKKEILSKIRKGNKDDSKNIKLEIYVNNTEEKILYEISSIEDYFTKLEKLISINSKINNLKFMRKILLVTNSIIKDQKKIDSLITIVQETDDIEYALKIISFIKNDILKFQLLQKLIMKTNNEKIILKILGIVERIEDNQWKAYTLLLASQKLNDKILLEKALEIVNLIQNSQIKLKTLILIAHQMNDQELIQKVLKQVINPTYQHTAYDQIEILLLIVKKTNDQESIQKIINFTKKLIKNFLLFGGLEICEYELKELFIELIQKSNNTKQILKIAKHLENDQYKLILLSLINKNDYNYINKYLKIAYSLKDKWKKAVALASIAQNINDINFALKIANSIEDDWKKANALSSITQKMDNINLALKTSNTIKNNIVRIKTFSFFKQKLSNNTFMNNYLFIQNQNHNIKINEALELSAIKDSDAVLRYYGIVEQKEQSKFENYLSKLRELKLKREEAENAENDKLYDEINQEVNILKQEIRKDEESFEKFLKIYNIKKIKYNSIDILEILD